MVRNVSNCFFLCRLEANIEITACAQVCEDEGEALEANYLAIDSKVRVVSLSVH